MLKKAVNHGVHGEHRVKTMDCTLLGLHPFGEATKDPKWPFSVLSVNSVVIELGFQG
jgi:hypothetical protein